ncbi:MAG: flagellar filament capping protein FliD [Treponema sp.]|nr:flagellar filament capping protein FliD [Treponema sp.]
MADGISIPGVTDKYKTNDLVESLMEVERVPLKREQAQLETYQHQQQAWRDMNSKMSTLRESVKTLYSFENPFNNKLATSSDENAVTVEADRNAEYGTFKLDVLQPAGADRFLSGNIDKGLKIAPGKYTFAVGDRTIEFNWKGGKLNDFVTSLNKHGNNLIKASLIGISSDKKALVFESLKPGIKNKLILKDQALELAKTIDMVSPITVEPAAMALSQDTFITPATLAPNPQAPAEENPQAPLAESEEAEAEGLAEEASPSPLEQEGLPPLSKDHVALTKNGIFIPARGGVEIPIPEALKTDGKQVIEFTIDAKQTQDITVAINNRIQHPVLPDPGFITFKGITVENDQSDTTLPEAQGGITSPLNPVEDSNYVFIKNADGSEIQLPEDSIKIDPETNQMKVSIRLADFPDAQSIVLRNSNTGKELSLSLPKTWDSSKDLGFTPNHPVSVANDAQIKYEGITLTRSSNDIDDVVPNVTLHIHDKTDKTATIKIEPDKESAKNALITFVGKYNQVIAEINILSSNKPEIISELDYLTKEEQEKEMEKLGMFSADFSLTTGKSTMQRIISANYNYNNEAQTQDLITMLNQIGISTNASGRSSGYNPAQMRGYLEVDEKKLDAQLENHLDEIKDLFGYDTDGDLIIDNGIGYLLDKQLTSWVQSGGIISTKTSALDSKIKNSNKKITNLETKLDAKEAELKQKYANMEGTLNSLESQQNTIKNFSTQNSNNKK